MIKGRIQHGLIETIGAESLYLFHRKAEQPCFHASLGSSRGQLKAKLGTTKLRECHLVMQKRAVLSPKTEDGLVPCFCQQADLSVQLQQMGFVRRCWKFVSTFHFQNAYGIDGGTPYQHKIEMGLDGHTLMLPVDFKLGQNMQSQRCQSLFHPCFKPVPTLQRKQTLQTVCYRQHLSSQCSSWAFPVLTDITHTHIGRSVAQVCGGILLGNSLQPLAL